MLNPNIYKDAEITTEKRKATGVIMLSRPDSLNALSLEMIRILSATLKRWEQDPEIRAVLIAGAGGRAFCAGGDIKATYYAGMSVRRGGADERIPVVFFAEEYLLNRQMHHYTKPLIAMMNGIVMGGGYGIAGQCRFRIACEKSVFAMPEVGIGFFPDVGSVWHLARMPDRAGFCLGLTGMAIGPADMRFTGVATHMTAQRELENLAGRLDDALAQSKSGPQVVIEKILAQSCKNHAERGELEQSRESIRKIFMLDDPEDIIHALKSGGTEFLEELAAIMLRRSPVSLKVTAAHLHKALEDKSFDDVIDRDFLVAQQFLKGNDFYEGVKTTLITKDRDPVWAPSVLRDVTPAMVKAYFQPTGRGLEEMAA